ncbi:MAG: PilZ domain-containing protein [Terracidiphilus sp.]|nr:PilZ domain-containing protein [Terracidiphilus sp.]
MVAFTSAEPGVSTGDIKMAHHQDPHESKVRQFQQIEGEVSTLGEESKGLTTRCWAYNQTRERLLSVDVEVTDFSADTFDARIAALTPGSGIALWVVPFRGIHPASVRGPLDFLYLDQNCVVLDAAGVYLISPESPSSALAASVVVLPAGAIDSNGIRIGDHFLLCPPEEMRKRLPQLVSARRETEFEQDEARGEHITLPADLPGIGSNNDMLKLEVHSRGNACPENVSVDALTDVASQPTPAPDPSSLRGTSEPARKTTMAPKNWWRSLWNRSAPDPRTAQRESPPFLIAYFFTGGAPVEHRVRDISLSGLYVVTDEQWYLGTVVRMTLTDLRPSIPDRSITLNASVVRLGNDGAALRFLLDDKRDIRSEHSPILEDAMGQVSKVRLKQFLLRLKTLEV